MTSPALDPIAILAALGVTDTTTATPVSGGQDTAIWRVEHGGMISALRVFRREEARRFRYEATAMQIAASGGIAVPQVRAEGVWQERPALLLSWCASRTLLAAFRSRPWRIRALARQFGRMQARIHAVNAATLQSHRGDWIRWVVPDEVA